MSRRGQSPLAGYMDKSLPAYTGPDPFVFVCYAHADSGLVYPEISRLQSQDFKIWYDDGISPGSEWSQAIAEAIESCSVFLYFITPNAVASEHCRREVNFALEQKCSILAVHLSETDVPSALRLSLSHRQAIVKYKLAEPIYSQRLENALRDAAEGKEDNAGLVQALQIGDFVLDITSQRLVTEAGEERHLDPKDLSVLLHIAEASPNVVSTEELLNRSWPGVIVGDNAVHQVIGHLRKAFGDKARNPSYIETLPRRGYRLLVPVKPVEVEIDRRPLPPPPAPPPPSEVESTPRSQQEERAARPTKRKIPRLIPIVVALLVFALTFFAVRSFFSTPADPQSVAVLPLVNLSPGEDLKALSQSIPIELWSELRAKDISLASSTQMVAYADVEYDIQEVGQDLGVSNLVVGTIRRSGSRVRVTLEMVPVDATHEILWAGIYEELVEDEFTTEKEIALQAANGIERTFGGAAPALQITPQDPSETKPTLQQIFDTEDPTVEEPTFINLEDVEFESFDEFGDVE